MRDIAARLDSWGEDFRRSRPLPARVGLLYSYESAILSRCLRPVVADLYERNLHGWYRALWERDLSPVILRAEMLEIPAGIDLLVLPCCLVVTGNLADGLRRFVQRGGKLIADARLGICDDGNRAHIPIPGPRLGTLFGVEEIDLGEDADGFLRQELALAPEARQRHGFVENGGAFYVPSCAGVAFLSGHPDGLLGSLEAAGVPRAAGTRVTRYRESERFRYRFVFDAATGFLLDLGRQDLGAPDTRRQG